MQLSLSLLSLPLTLALSLCFSLRLGVSRRSRVAGERRVRASQEHARSAYQINGAGVFVAYRLYIVYRLLGPVVPSFQALPGRLKFTVRHHKFNKDSPSWCQDI